MIQVCDAIMGTGKSSAAITYMNEHKDEKFIYITPYLDEVKRIKLSCPDMDFAEPSNKIRKYNFKKSEHTAALIHHGRNIATTHQAFKMYSEDMLDDIRRHGYRLIIDENVDVLERYDCHEDDISMLVKSGYVEERNGTYSLVKDDYKGSLFKETFKFLKTRDLVCMDDTTECGSLIRFFYWVLPPKLITAFKSVIILTYLFRGQSLYYFLTLYNLPYTYIGIEKTADEEFRFCKYPGYTPEYVSQLSDMVHILENEKMNSIGDDLHAMSMNWFERKDDEVEQLQKNVYNYINNIHRGIPADEKLCGGFKSSWSKLRGKGYAKAFLTFNAKATNAYRGRKYLVYTSNIFMNVTDARFYMKNGIKVDEDAYALSIMVQWIWRSAIRDGCEIYLYIPSRRMRNLLINWIKITSKGGNTVEE